MKVVIILTGGRAGSDLLQSLFDNHAQILQFPGVLTFDKKFNKIFFLKSANKISKYFIKTNKHFFDSRHNKTERHNKLGFKKKSFYIVNKKIFIKKFLKIYNKSKKTNFDLLLSLHKAYYKHSKKKKLLIVHVHLFEFLKNYIKFIGINNNSKVLLTLRDPLASMCSTVNHWLKYKKGIILNPRHLFYNFDLHFNNFNNLYFLRKKIRVVKLEKLHKFSVTTIKKLCNFLDINFSKNLLKSTYHGKKWWGDAISKKYLNGLNKNFRNKFDYSLFKEKEIFYLESKIFSVLKKYNYPFRSNVKKNNNFLYLMPLNIEKKIFFNTLKVKRFKSALSFPYFLIRRIFLLKNKNIFNKSTLPREI